MTTTAAIPARLLVAAFLALLLVALWSPAWGQDERRPRDAGFERFRVIVERNIFEPNRGPARGHRPAQEVRRDDPPPVETLALLGAVVYDSTVVAVFTGSRPDFRATVRPGDNLADMRVAEIRIGGVTFEGASGRLELPVGWHLRRVAGGEWQVASGPLPQQVRRREESRAVSASGSQPGRPAGVVESDTARRMRERREREESE
ncbi:hypothetical protein HS125_04830 [bacterium]|nr:hypothetical protein [bacterium]